MRDNEGNAALSESTQISFDWKVYGLCAVGLLIIICAVIFVVRLYVSSRSSQNDIENYASVGFGESAEPNSYEMIPTTETSISNENYEFN